MEEAKLRKVLPIGENEKVLAIIKHHWFAYFMIYLGAGLLCLLVLAGIILAASSQQQLGLSDSAINGVIALGLVFMAVIAAFAMVPVWIKKQERLILTEEALLQLEKPSVMANKTSQLNLAHIADVTVRQDTFGTIFGYGNLLIETPGEQNNYSFSIVGKPRDMAKKIIEAHENYAAALESGQIQTTLGARPPTPGTAWRAAAEYPQTPPPQTATPQTNPQPPTQPPTDQNDQTPPQTA